MCIRSCVEWDIWISLCWCQSLHYCPLHFPLLHFWNLHGQELTVTHAIVVSALTDSVEPICLNFWVCPLFSHVPEQRMMCNFIFVPDSVDKFFICSSILFILVQFWQLLATNNGENQPRRIGQPQRTTISSTKKIMKKKHTVSGQIYSILHFFSTWLLSMPCPMRGGRVQYQPERKREKKKIMASLTSPSEFSGIGKQCI